MLRKKLLIFLIIGLLSLGLMTTVGAQDKINVKLDNAVLVFEDQEPLIIDGRTMVPMRKIFETLGADIQWDGTTNTITALKEVIKIDLKIGDRTAKKNGQDVILEVPAQILNGRTMVPLRFVSEAMGANVSWDESTKTVVMSTKEIRETNTDVPSTVEPNKTEGTSTSGASTSNFEQLYDRMRNNIQALVNDGTITQTQVEKIIDAFIVPGSGIMLSPNALNALVEQGVITQEQAAAVMNVVGPGSRQRVNP